LGLSIVYQLVESSGGRIEFTPAPEGELGATFSLFFPRNSAFSLAK
jgi:signal transduction histidine kinase